MSDEMNVPLAHYELACNEREEAKAEIARLEARVAELEAALERIVSEGTVEKSERVGDAYDFKNGYRDWIEVHPLAEIARAALASAGGEHPDTRRLDWLEKQNVTVCPPGEWAEGGDWKAIGQASIREFIDLARSKTN